MALLNKNILVIGYGCVGKIHEKVWQKKKYNIFYVDLDWDKIKSKKNKYHGLKEFFTAIPLNKRRDFVYDVCCDTENHLKVLKTISKFQKQAKIIIEKPIVSSNKELKEFIEFLNKHKSIKVFINENYFFSKTLEVVKQKIKKYKIKPNNIYIEFSKDRKTDVANNRFVDRRLGVFGLEFPHMLAILDYLGFDKNLKILNVKHNSKNSAQAELKSSLIKINLKSSLVGKFFYQEQIKKNLFANNRFRVTDIKSKDYQIIVLWEPLKNKKRLYNRIIIKKQNKVVEDFYVYDNTMLTTLTKAEKYFKSNRIDPEKNLVDKCCKIVKILNNLLEKC